VEEEEQEEEGEEKEEEEEEEEKEEEEVEQYTEAEIIVIRRFLVHKLHYSEDLADVVTGNPEDADWKLTRHPLASTPKYSKDNSLRPTNTTARCRVCSNKCSAFCTLCFQFGGPCADMVPTCSTCGHEHYVECHGGGSSSVKKTLSLGARIPLTNPLQIHPLHV
jgi:hypothetical protein